MVGEVEGVRVMQGLVNECRVGCGEMKRMYRNQASLRPRSSKLLAGNGERAMADPMMM